MADPTWSDPIRGFFTEVDIEHMNDLGLDLSSYSAVKAGVDAIYDQVRSGSMPPDDPWPSDRVATFDAWRSAGCPE